VSRRRTDLGTVSAGVVSWLTSASAVALVLVSLPALASRPAPPSNLTATLEDQPSPKPTAVRLAWDESPDPLIGYQIQRCYPFADGSEVCEQIASPHPGWPASEINPLEGVATYLDGEWGLAAFSTAPPSGPRCYYLRSAAGPRSSVRSEPACIDYPETQSVGPRAWLNPPRPECVTGADGVPRARFRLDWTGAGSDVYRRPESEYATATPWVKIGEGARSVETWGQMSGPDVGAVAVLWRGSPGAATGHVGFLLGHGSGRVILLGGNQGNAVSVTTYPEDRVVCYRRPTA